jgi:hypothetical protein
MTTATLTQKLLLDREKVPLGRRVFANKRDCFPYAPQKCLIDRARLEPNYYGEAALSKLERGHFITYCDLELTGPDRQILEFPDGARYSFALEFLGGETMAVDIIERLPDAAR